MMGLVIEWLYRDEDEALSPEAVAVLYYLGQAHPERMPWVAAHWLASGYDGEDLVRMAGLHGDDPREVGDVLPGALLDCGARLPDSDVAAAGDVFTRVARRHLDGRVDAGQVVFVAGAVLAWLGYPEDVLSCRSAGWRTSRTNGTRSGAGPRTRSRRWCGMPASSSSPGCRTYRRPLPGTSRGEGAWAEFRGPRKAGEERERHRRRTARGRGHPGGPQGRLGDVPAAVRARKIMRL